MKKDELYASNIELLARDNPEEAYCLESDSFRLKVCQTLDDEVNLVDNSSEPPFYLHDQGGAVWAAQQWAKSLSLGQDDVLFVYGLGLGYYYLPLKEWLKDPSHYLVFLEDDKEIVHHFLQTSLAAEILTNSQIIVKILPSIEPNEEGWLKLRSSAESLFRAFAFASPEISALQSYFYSRHAFFQSFSLQWLSELSRAAEQLKEFRMPYTSEVFRNFYANLPYLGEAIPGYHLKNALESIPAVLCGAGPSLSKQFPLLKTLSDKALLMGSGSAMNALTQASIVPHVGGAIDPTPDQASRQLTSFAFDVPAFYQNRFYWKAFTQWHGPLLYMTGSGAYKVSEWFEQELRIEAEPIIMGVSTSNFLLEIARFLGCDPIILVGMDLAYTRDQRYAEGVLAHPTEDIIQKESLDRKETNLLSVPSVEGGEVLTTKQWIFEAVCMGAFRLRNSKTVCINATEGGQSIPFIPNEPFSKVIEERLVYAWDIEGWFHGVIQNASADRIPSSKVFEALAKWKKSLEACITQNEKLDQEPAYAYLLETLSSVFDGLNSLRIRKLKWLSGEEQSIEQDRRQFLRMYAEDHLKSLKAGLKAFEEREAILSQKIPQQRRLETSLIPPEYPVPIGSERKIKTYPDGKIKVEAYYHSGKLHGPWRFYSPEGRVLYCSQFTEGKKDGKAFAYYLDGALYNIVQYIEGVREGEQLHYYSDGTLKTVECYKKGLLNGKVQLYYVNGQMKKEQHFQDGRLHGLERMWNEKGELTLESEW